MLESSSVIDSRVRAAFHKAVLRRLDLGFSVNEIFVSDHKKVGIPVLCRINAEKQCDDQSQATGMAWVYSDLIVICLESFQRNKDGEINYPCGYEYLTC